jgi:hypothetical protein
MMKIFGREPAAIVSLITALVALLVAFNFPGLSAEAGAAVVTFLGGVIIAVTTRPWAPGLFAGLVASGAALAAGWGWHATDAQVASASALVMVAFSVFGSRPQVTPISDPKVVDGVVVTSGPVKQ